MKDKLTVEQRAVVHDRCLLSFTILSSLLVVYLCLIACIDAVDCVTQRRSTIALTHVLSPRVEYV